VSKKRSTRASKPKRPKEPAAIELDGRLSIAQAGDLRRTLLARLDEGRAVAVDGTRVEEIDTAILQLLASLWRTCRQRGIGCTWLGASETLRRTAALIGVAEMLYFPASESAGERGHGTRFRS
jgi:anti-anti-sigma regulatory factor